MNHKKEAPPKKLNISGLLSTVVLLVSVILCLTVIVQVMTNGYVQIGGYSLFRVVTGSMEPTLPVGSLLVCRKTPAQEIRVGDIVCFVSREPNMMGKVITHRVVHIHQDAGAAPLLETKGDANLSADSELVSANYLIGRVDHYAKDGSFMPSFINILTDKIGFLMLVLFPTLLLAGMILRSSISNMRKNLEIVLEEEKKRKMDPSGLYTDEEYTQMIARIKSELVEELMQNAGEENQGTAENAKTE